MIDALSVNDPSEIIPSKLTMPPWIVPDGVGTIVCAGTDSSGPREMLFGLRAPIGPSWAVGEVHPSAILAKYAAFIVGTVNDYKAISAENALFRNALIEIAGVLRLDRCDDPDFVVEIAKEALRRASVVPSQDRGTV